MNTVFAGAFFTGALVLTGCSSASPAFQPPAAVVSVGLSTSSPANTTTPTPTPAVSEPVKPVPAATAPPASTKTHPETTAPVAAPVMLVAQVLHNTPVVAAPGGARVGTVNARTGEVATWLPVRAQKPGWVQIQFLNTKKLATGWIPAGIARVYATDSWVEVKRGAKTISIHTPGKSDRTWKVLALGSAADQWPTPLGAWWIVDAPSPCLGRECPAGSPAPNPVYGNGPWVETSAPAAWGDIIAIHSWHAPIRPGESSHGCVRAPDAAVAAIAKLPYGTAVIVSP